MPVSNINSKQKKKKYNTPLPMHFQTTEGLANSIKGKPSQFFQVRKGREELWNKTVLPSLLLSVNNTGKIQHQYKQFYHTSVYRVTLAVP